MNDVDFVNLVKTTKIILRDKTFPEKEKMITKYKQNIDTNWCISLKNITKQYIRNILSTIIKKVRYL